MNQEPQTPITLSSAEIPPSRPVIVKKHKGSIILVILIIVLLIVAGAAAYWWRNKTANDSADKQAANIATLNTKLEKLKAESVKTVASPTSTSSTQSLSISEWGIKGNYIGSTPISYKIVGNSVDFFLTTTYPSTDCSQSFAKITRLTSDMSYVDFAGDSAVSASVYYNNNYHNGLNNKIGDYYYFFSTLGATDECPGGTVAGSGPTQAVATAARAAELQAVNEVEQFTINAVAI